MGSDPRYGCALCRAVYRTQFPRCPRDGGNLSPLLADPLIGATVAERYILEAQLGEGAMGLVYRARHARMSRRFAIKVMFGDLAADTRMRARFSQEAEAASRLSHPNVVSVVDFGETQDGLLYLAMDLVEGRSLGDVLHQSGPIAPIQAASIVRQIALGLEHAHARGLIHRDLKPDNILIARDGDQVLARLVDFGIAMIRSEDGDAARLTATGAIVGTPAYMSPEQASRIPVDHRSDLFSLGLVFYQMLSGRLPHDGDALELLRKNMVIEAPSFARRAPGVAVPVELERIVLRLLEKAAADRYPTARALVEAIDALGDPGPTQILPRPKLVDPASTQAMELGDDELAAVGLSRHPGRTWATTGAVLLGGAAILIGVVLFRGGGSFNAVPIAAEPEPSVAIAAPPPTPAVNPPAVTPLPPPAIVAPAPLPVKHPAVAVQHPRRELPVPALVAPPPAAAPPEEKGPIETDAFTARYRATGAAVDRFEQKHGAEDADAFRRRYFSIPFTDALRDPALRAEIVERLDALDRDLRSASAAE